MLPRKIALIIYCIATTIVNRSQLLKLSPLSPISQRKLPQCRIAKNLQFNEKNKFRKNVKKKIKEETLQFRYLYPKTNKIKSKKSKVGISFRTL